jgi:hypothetical protein
MQEINESETTFTLESGDCDGTDATVIANKECTVNISTLLASPYNYDGGDTIYAKVSAVNIYGESDQSVESSGLQYNEVPDAPLNLAENNSVRTSTNNGLTWSPGVLDGGQAVINYRINQKVQGGSYSVIATGVT